MFQQASKSACEYLSRVTYVPLISVKNISTWGEFGPPVGSGEPSWNGVESGGNRTIQQEEVW